MTVTTTFKLLPHTPCQSLCHGHHWHHGTWTYWIILRNPSWGMWVEIVYSLSTTLTSLAISASSTDLKRIQTPHSLEFKLHTGRVQVWVRVWAPAGQLAISPEGYSSRQLRVWLQNQLPGSWGHSPAWTHMTSKHTKLPSQLQSWLACLGKKCCHSMILTISGFLGNLLLWHTY